MATEAPDNLEPIKQKALLALLTEPTIKKAAESISIGERTLHRWLQEDEVFAREYRKALHNMFSQGTALAQKYVSMAVQTLAKVMADATAPHAAKVSASNGLLRYSREAIETDDLAVRVEALEKTEEQRRNSP